jgi:hypothetical protein
MIAVEDEPGSEVVGVWMFLPEPGASVDQISARIDGAWERILPQAPPGHNYWEDELPVDWPAAPSADELVARLAAAGLRLDASTALPQAVPDEGVMLIVWRIVDCRVLTENAGRSDSSPRPLLVRVRSIFGVEKSFVLVGSWNHPLLVLAHDWGDSASDLEQAHSCP